MSGSMFLIIKNNWPVTSIIKCECLRALRSVNSNIVPDDSLKTLLEEVTCSGEAMKFMAV